MEDEGEKEGEGERREGVGEREGREEFLTVDKNMSTCRSSIHSYMPHSFLTIRCQ